MVITSRKHGAFVLLLGALTAAAACSEPRGPVFERTTTTSFSARGCEVAIHGSTFDGETNIISLSDDFAPVDVAAFVVPAEGGDCGDGPEFPLQLQMTTSSGTWAGQVAHILSSAEVDRRVEVEITPTFESDNWHCTGWETATITCDVTPTVVVDLSSCARDEGGKLACPVDANLSLFIPGEYEGRAGKAFWEPSVAGDASRMGILGLVDADPDFSIAAQVCFRGESSSCVRRTSANV